MQMRPKALTRIWLHKDHHVRRGMQWYTRMGRRVWFHEIADFVFHRRIRNSTLTLRKFWGASLSDGEESMVKRRRAVVPIRTSDPQP